MFGLLACWCATCSNLVILERIAWANGFANAVDFVISAKHATNGLPIARRALYSTPMSKLRMLMISRMVKPEEVLIVEDENGNIVRETLKDNDVLVQ